jgi:hypothetical protein
MVPQLTVGQGLLIIMALQSHSNTPHSVGLLWVNDQPDTLPDNTQHSQETDIHVNPQFQQASSCRPTP